MACAAPGARSRNRSSAASPRAWFRAMRTSRAPMAASSSAATWPMPEVAPVMTQVFPSSCLTHRLACNPAPYWRPAHPARGSGRSCVNAIRSSRAQSARESSSHNVKEVQDAGTTTQFYTNSSAQVLNRAMSDCVGTQEPQCSAAASMPSAANACQCSRHSWIVTSPSVAGTPAEIGSRDARMHPVIADDEGNMACTRLSRANVMKSGGSVSVHSICSLGRTEPPAAKKMSPVLENRRIA